MLDKADGRAGGSCFSGVNENIPLIPVGAGQSSGGNASAGIYLCCSLMPRMEGMPVQAAPAAPAAKGTALQVVPGGPGGFHATVGLFSRAATVKAQLPPPSLPAFALVLLCYLVSSRELLAQ